MRKLVAFILLAGAAVTPALAAPGDWPGRQQAREDRAEAREQRVQESVSRPERPAMSERVDRVGRAERFQRVETPRAMTEAPAGAQAVGRANFGDLQAVRDARRQQPDSVRDWRSADRRQQTDSVRDWRSGQRQQMAAPGVQPQRAGGFRDGFEQRRIEAQQRLMALRNARPPVVSTTPMPGTQPPPPVAQRPSPPVQWSGNWRNDARYNWYDWRRRNSSLFNLGFYYDPFGWGYQPYMVGWRMWPSYYGSQFWLDDPWEYRLPYAPMGTRWVRYWDDAVLVDTWSGQVVDVIYNFFW